MQLSRRYLRGSHTDRLDVAIERAKRLAYMPGTMAQRAEMAATAIIPLGFYGCNAATLPVKVLDTFASNSTKAVWGAGRRYRSRSLVAS